MNDGTSIDLIKLTVSKSSLFTCLTWNKNWSDNQILKVYYLAVGGRWLDKLGVAARMGIDVVVRQSFFHGHYALLDNYMHPRPVRSFCILYTSISQFFLQRVHCWIHHSTLTASFIL